MNKGKTAEETLKKWYNPLNGIGDIAELQIVEAMKEYALSVAQKALENAAENALMKYHCGHFKTYTPTQYHQHGADNIQIDKQSILDEKNIPKEVRS